MTDKKSGGVMVSFRAMRETAARLTEAARRVGVSRSEFIRNAALAAARALEADGVVSP